MLKRITAGLIVLCSLLFLVACNSNADTQKTKEYADKPFYTALVNGLQDRWELYDTHEEAGTTDTADAWKAYIDAELHHVASFRNKEFKSSQLHEHAISYINALKAQKKLTPKYGISSNFGKEWNENLDKRLVALGKINKHNPIEVAEEHQKSLEEVLGTATAIEKSADEEAQINQMLNNIKFVLAENNSGYKRYEATVENTTDTDFKDFFMDIKLINAEGVTVDETIASTKNWRSGSKVRLEFHTEANFEKYELSAQTY